MNIHSSDFELFGVSERFAQEGGHLTARWKELQREAHPDKFAAQGAAAQRLAMQWSVRINEAYQRLKNPLKRASYLCERRGERIDAETNTAMPASFLQQQIELRELLDEATSLQDYEQIHAKSLCNKRSVLSKIERLIDVDKDFKTAAQEVRSLMFIERFINEVTHRIEQLEQSIR